jgi:glycosyltransferase involved in cell wall biosynthesis
LEKVGVETEFLRWYDGDQKGDILHFFGRIPPQLLSLAREKGMKIVMAELLTEQGSRSGGQLRMQRLISRLIEKAAPGLSADAFGWQSYRRADACVALTSWEAQLMQQLFDAPRARVHVIPNGVEEVFLQSTPAAHGPWMVCTATITERKRVVEMAEAAVRAETPLWVIGKAYTETDPYAKRFFELARQNPKFIRFEGAIEDRARLAAIYREARGFVLLSAMESLSLSALEAAACECPLLLSDLPWARTTFSDTVKYCPVTTDMKKTAAVLRQFYDAAPTLQPPAKPVTWLEVARQLKALYETLLKTSR